MVGKCVKLCHLDDLPQGDAKGFDPLNEGQDTLLLVRRGGRVHAYRDFCPHQGAPMAWRKDMYLNTNGTHIVCHAHGAHFDIATGECTLGPALGQSLDPVVIAVSEDGEIHVETSQLHD